MKRLLNATDKGQAAARKKQTAELKKAEKRKAEVDTLFARMYEDWAAGRITEYNFSMLSGKYQSEQAELDEKIEQLQSAIATESQNAADAEKWIALMPWVRFCMGRKVRFFLTSSSTSYRSGSLSLGISTVFMPSR